MANNVINHHLPLMYRIFKLFGFLPLTVGSRENEFHYLSSKLAKLYSLFVYVMVVFPIIYFLHELYSDITQITKDLQDSSLTFAVVATLNFLSVFLTGSGDVFFALARSHEISNILTTLSKIKGIVCGNDMHRKQYWTRFVYQIIIPTISIFVLGVCECIIYMSRSSTRGVMEQFALVCYYILMFQNIMFEMFHLNTVVMLNDCLSALNIQISQGGTSVRKGTLFRKTFCLTVSVPADESSLEPSRPLLSNSQILQYFRGLHDELCELISRISGCCGFTLVTHLIEIFVSSLCYLFYSFYVLVQLHPLNANWILTLNTAWIIVYFVRLTVITRTCSSTSSEADRTGALVHRLLKRDMNPNMKEELQLFASQLLHKKSEFTACGLFPINLSLLHSVVAAVTTYLVILIQFQSSSSPHPPSFPRPPHPGEDNITESTPMLFTPS